MTTGDCLLWWYQYKQYMIMSEMIVIGERGEGGRERERERRIERDEERER